MALAVSNARRRSETGIGTSAWNGDARLPPRAGWSNGGRGRGNAEAGLGCEEAGRENKHGRSDCSRHGGRQRRRSGVVAGAGRSWVLPWCWPGVAREPLDETASLIPNGRGFAVPADVTDPESVAGLFEAIQARVRSPRSVVQQCRRQRAEHEFRDSHLGGVADGAVAQSRRHVPVANGAYKMMRDQSPQGGRIINNGSISAHAPRPVSAPTPRPSTRSPG